MNASIDKKPIDIARTVLDMEIEGLNALKDHLEGELGQDFTRAIEHLANTKGRVIVTGMGKSGHIARKIAATLSSTGTPALYVHPGEASHGDLGMIARDDSIIALSKSGETAELGDILGFATRFSIPVIAITAGGDAATLAISATISLTLPKIAEACAVTNAPTTSTTMMIALGDALCVCLLQYKGLTTTQFHGLHPGGLLGQALRRVKDLMHPYAGGKLPLCAHSATMSDAISTLSKGGFGCVGFVDDDGKLTGILTDGDIRRHFGHCDDTTPAHTLMTKTPRTVAPETIAGDALAIMSADKITALFVIDEGRPIGLLHIHDCLASGIL